MSKKSDTRKKTQNGMPDITHDIWLAGLGVLSSVEEEGSKLYRKFIERGEEIIEKGREFEKKEKIQGISLRLSQAAKAVEEKVQACTEPLGLSSREEIKELNAKIDKLAESLAVLTKKLDK